MKQQAILFIESFYLALGFEPETARGTAVMTFIAGIGIAVFVAALVGVSFFCKSESKENW